MSHQINLTNFNASETFLVSALTSTNGNLTEALHIPNNEAAYLTDGCSINNDECNGCNNLSISAASSIFSYKHVKIGC